MILNFISNSVKFTKFGKIELSFKFDPLTESLIINVSDTGIGIKDEDKEKLFNDFNLHKVLTTWDKKIITSSIKELLEKEYDFNRHKKIAQKLFNINSLIQKIVT